MRINRAFPILAPLVVVAVFTVSAVAQKPEQPETAAPAPPAPARHPARPRPAPAKPPAATEVKPTLLGQYDGWGAYTATPDGKKICFAIAKPTSAETKPPNRPRNPPHMFISTRPVDKITNEVSIAIGYPLKAGTEASVEVGTTTFTLSTQGEGAWIKNVAEQSHMVDVMRQGDTAVVKGESSRGTQSTDTYALKGLSEALDRVAQECQ
jgi:invasion protein IalB